MDQGSDPTPLEKELREGLVPYVCDQEKYFLPNTALDSIVQYDKVHHMLEGLQFKDNSEHTLLVYIESHLITLLGQILL